MKCKPRTNRTGFTLVELLIVIAIILILIGLLLPAIGKARGQAQATQCASNMRQIYLAQMSYADANEGHVTTVDFQGINSAWTLRLTKYLSNTGTPPEQIINCPLVNADEIQAGTQWLPPTTSYGMNPFIMLTNWNGKRTVRAKSSETILMSEKASNYEDFVKTEDGVYFFVDPNLQDFDGVTVHYLSHLGNRARRHANGSRANALMLDGHVEALDANSLGENSGHWYFGNPNFSETEIPYCPCCGP